MHVQAHNCVPASVLAVDENAAVNPNNVSNISSPEYFGKDNKELHLPFS